MNGLRKDGRATMKIKQQPPCFTCEEYQYIGEGDAICIKNSRPVIVEEDWMFVYPKTPCKKLMKWIKEVNTDAN